MDQYKAKALLSLMGSRVPQSTSNPLQCSCVFAPWKHNGGTDNHPSSSLRMEEGQPERYDCYTCGSSGTLEQIYHEIKYLNKKTSHITLNAKKIISLLGTELLQVPELEIPDYEVEINKKAAQLFPFSESWYAGYPSAVGHPYLKERGVSKKMSKLMDVRVDFMKHRILFPIRNWDGVLLGAHGRSYNDNSLRYYAYPQDDIFEGPRNPSIWMGEDHVLLPSTVILVEGQFDYAKVRKWTDSVLCGLTTKPSLGKLKRLRGVEEIITIYDHGVGGDQGRQRINKYFPNTLRQHITVPKKYGDLGSTPDKIVYDILTNIS